MFKSVLEAVYFNRNHQITAMNKILFLYQTNSVAIYTSKFMFLVNALNFNNNVKLFHF